MNLSTWQQIIGEWSVETFGPGLLRWATLVKLREEVEELANAAPENMAEEAADCLLVLLSLAYRIALTFKRQLQQSTMSTEVDGGHG